MKDGKENTEAKENARFNAGSGEYQGVIFAFGQWRLVLSVKGTWYMLQLDVTESGGEQVFYTCNKAKKLARLLDKLPAPMRAKLPDDLPDDPREYRRPWAEEMKTASQRFARASKANDAYSGVIASSKLGRLVWLWADPAPKYALQVYSKQYGWKNVSVAFGTDKLLDVLQGVTNYKSSRQFAGDKVLVQAVRTLPELAEDWTGQRPETLEEVRAAYRMPKTRAPGRPRPGAKHSAAVRPAQRPHGGAKHRQGGKAAKAG